MTGVRAAARRIPVDVVWILVAITVTYAVTGLGSGSPVRLAVALAFLLFVPGYALTTAVFPARLAPARRQQSHPLGPAPGAALDGVERAGVSFGISLVLLPLFGLALAALSWPLTPRWILVVTAAFVIVTTAVGAVRRARLPDEARYAPDAGRWVGRYRDAFGDAGHRDAVLQVVLAFAVVFAAGALATAIVAPLDGTNYTELSLLTTTEQGDLVAADYPTAFTQGDGQPLVVEVTNHENREVRYTVVVALERIDDDRTTERDELDRFEKRIPPESTWQIRHTVTPTMAGDDLRLTYLLYEGQPPPEPTISNAYRHAYLWIDVSG